MTISVLIPVYNKEKYIVQTLFTVDRQITNDLFDIEVVIIDDQSTDRSWEIITNYQWKNIPEQNIKLKRNDRNLGPSRSYIEALSISQGSFIATLDADDLLTQYSLIRRYEALSPSNMDWVSGLSLAIEDDGQFVAGREFKKPLLHEEQPDWVAMFLKGEIFFPTSTTLYKRDALQKHGWIPDMRSSQEFGLNLNLLVHQKFPLLINEYSSIYRCHHEGSADSLYQITKASGQKSKDFKLLKEKLGLALSYKYQIMLDQWIDKWKDF